MAYSKPLLGAVPTKSGAAVRIKRQQLKAETQRPKCKPRHKNNMQGKCAMSHFAFQRFQMKSSHHLVCLSNAIIMEIQQINTSIYSFVVLQAFCSRAVTKSKSKMTNCKVNSCFMFFWFNTYPFFQFIFAAHFKRLRNSAFENHIRLTHIHMLDRNLDVYRNL